MIKTRMFTNNYADNHGWNECVSCTNLFAVLFLVLFFFIFSSIIAPDPAFATGNDSYTKLLLHFDGDQASTGYVVTVNGDPDLTTSGASKFNGSMYFDGTGDYLVTNLNTDTLTGVVTFDFWFYPTAGGRRTILSGFNGANRWDIEYDRNGSDEIEFLQYDGNLFGASTAAIPENEWTHIAVIHDFANTSVTLYINGEYDSAHAISHPLASSTNFSIGARPDGTTGGSNMQGYIDELRVSVGVNRYVTNFSLPSEEYESDEYTELLLHFDGDQASGAGTPAHYVTFNGDADLHTTGKFNGSVYFDGTGDFLSIPSSDDWNFGSGNFTIDFWINSAVASGACIESSADANNNWDVSLWFQRIYFRHESGGVEETEFFTTNQDISLNQWHHIAIVRDGGTGYIFIDGDSKATTVNTALAPLTDVDGDLNIGKDTEYGRVHTGYIDEVRISKGVARWTANFDPPPEPYATSVIYRSVGPSNVSALTSSGTLTISGTTATFGGAVPNTVGVGDVIQYDDDNDGDIDANDSVCFISARTSSTVFEVRAHDGGYPTQPTATDTDWSIFRAYTSLANAETGTENTGIDADLRNFDTWSGGRDLVANGEQWNIACYADDTDSAIVAIDGWVTSENNFLKVFAPNLQSQVGISQRHAGRWQNGRYRLSVDSGTGTYALEVSDPYTIIEGLQVEPIGIYNMSGIGVTSTYGVKVRNNITRYSSTAGGDVGINLSMAETADGIYIYNNIIYDYASGINHAALDADSPIYNNTIVDCTTGIDGHWQNRMLCINNIVYNASTAFADTFHASSDYNATDSGSATGGSNDKTGQSFAFANYAADDFHISAVDSAARDAGTDLSNDLTLAFTTDIDGGTRPYNDRWDIGADEYGADFVTRIYRSVGPSSTTALTSSGTLTISGMIATFGGACPDTMGVGDIIEYDYDGDTSNDSIAFITGRVSSSQFTVQSLTGSTPMQTTAVDTDWEAFRAYTSLANAVSGVENTGCSLFGVGALVDLPAAASGYDLVSNGMQWHIACYADGADSTKTTINGWTTNADNYLRIFTPVNLFEVGTTQRHAGVWNTNFYYLEGNGAYEGILRVVDNDVMIDGLQLSNTGDADADNPAGFYLEGAGRYTISNNIIRFNGSGTLSSGSEAGIYLNLIASGAIAYVYNNIVYGFYDGILYAYGFGPFTAVLYNNTVVDTVNNGIQMEGDADEIILYLKNNLVFNTADDYAISNFTDQDYDFNMGEDAAFTGDGNYVVTAQSGSEIFKNYAGDDFHIKTSSDAYGAGTPLSEDSVLAVMNDIDGESRTGRWDIGADHYIPSGPLRGAVIIVAKLIKKICLSGMNFFGEQC